MKTIEEEEFYLQTKFGKIHIRVSEYHERKGHNTVYLLSSPIGSESDVMYNTQHTVLMKKPKSQKTEKEIKSMAKEFKKKLDE